MARICCTCFHPAASPRIVRVYKDGFLIRNAEQCVDPSHDAEVLSGSAGVTARDFLRAAIKRWRGSTRQASLRMYHTAVPPTQAAV